MVIYYPLGTSTADAKNKAIITRWNRIKQSKGVKLYSRINSDICNIQRYLIPVVQLQFKFTKDRSQFYLMNNDEEWKTVFKFLDDKLFVQPRPTYSDDLDGEQYLPRQRSSRTI